VRSQPFLASPISDVALLRLSGSLERSPAAFPVCPEADAAGRPLRFELDELAGGRGLAGAEKSLFRLDRQARSGPCGPPCGGKTAKEWDAARL
jgi:hypothetical protein